MYVDIQTIITASSLLGAVSALVGAIIAIYKQIEMNQRQNRLIEAILAEQKITLKGVRAALQGLIEKGCDGPCEEALKILNDHLNSRSHSSDLL